MHLSGTRRRRSPALITLVALLALLGWAPEVASADDTDPGLAQTISPDQATGTGKVTLTKGHIDIGPRLVDGAWSLQVHDDTGPQSLWRHLDDVVLKVSDKAILTTPDNDDYSFLHQKPGTKVYVIPQTQKPDVVWVGWNTQDPNVMNSLNLGATFSLAGVQGPGDMVVYLQSGNLGKPQPLWDSTTKKRQDLWVDVNTHTHANWVFSKPGVYLVDFRVSAELKSGKKVSTDQVVRFAVGDKTTAAQARAATYHGAKAADPAASSTAKPESDDGGSNTGRYVVYGVGAALVVLVLAGIGSAVRGHRARRAAEALRAGADSTAATSGGTDAEDDR